MNPSSLSHFFIKKMQIQVCFLKIKAAQERIPSGFNLEPTPHEGTSRKECSQNLQKYQLAHALG